MNILKSWHYLKTKRKAREILRLGSLSKITNAIAFLNDKIVCTFSTTEKTIVFVRKDDVQKKLFETSFASNEILERINHTTFVFANKNDVSVCLIYDSDEFKKHDIGIKGAKFVKMISNTEFIVVTSENEMHSVYLGARNTVGKIQKFDTRVYGYIENVIITPDQKVLIITNSKYSPVSCFKKNKKGDYIMIDRKFSLYNECLCSARFGKNFIVMDRSNGEICHCPDNKGVVECVCSFEKNGSMSFNSVVTLDYGDIFYVCVNDSYESMIKECTFKNGKVKIGKVVTRFNSPDCRIVKGYNYSLMVVYDNVVSKIQL